MRITSQGPQDPQEGLLILVVALGRDIVILQASLAVEGDLSGLDLPLLHVHLVAHHHDGQRLHHSRQVLVPLGHRLVGDAGSDIKHENGGIGTNVVPLTQTTQLLLPGRVPQVETDGSMRGVESDGADLDALRRNVVLLKLTRDVPLEEGGLAYSAVAHQDDLELGSRRRRLLLVHGDFSVRLHPVII